MKLRRLLLPFTPLLFPISLLLRAPAVAGDPVAASQKSPPDKEESKSFAEQLWSLPVLYKNKDNPFLQELALVGRYQGQWHSTSSHTGGDAGWENRRARLGLEAKFLGAFEFEGEFNLAWGKDNEGRLFREVDTAAFKYVPNEDFYAIAGKQKVKITQEFATSNNRILTVERSLLVNQVIPDKVGGLVVGNKFGDFLIEGGVYSGDLTEEWLLPRFGAGYGFSVRVIYHPSDKSEIRLDYFHQDGERENIAFETYGNIVSLNSTNKWGRWGLIGDIMLAGGVHGTPDVYGVMVMPHFDITGKLRAVFRYQYASSDAPDGLDLQSRYERVSIGPGRSGSGRDYHALYAGLNYYIYGDRLKLMSGLEYASMGGDANFDAWTLFGGCRLYF
jgi:phosphate-selective porin OprO/OprP